MFKDQTPWNDEVASTILSTGGGSVNCVIEFWSPSVSVQLNWCMIGLQAPQVEGSCAGPGIKMTSTCFESSKMILFKRKVVWLDESLSIVNISPESTIMDPSV